MSFGLKNCALQFAPHTKKLVFVVIGIIVVVYTYGSIYMHIHNVLNFKINLTIINKIKKKKL